MPTLLGAGVAASTDYAGSFESPSITTGDVPNGFWAWWWDTVNLKLFLVRNRAGTIYAVELTQI